MKWTGEWIAAFSLTLYFRFLSGFGKTAPRYLDLIHFPLPVRTSCLIPDIGSTERGQRERDSEKETGGRGRRGWVNI